MAEWSINLDKFFDDAELSLDQQYRAIGLQLLSDVVLLTPVDTGRLRGAWFYSIGAPKEGGGEIAFGKNAAESTGPATQHAIDVGSQGIAGAKITDVLYLQDNVEYGPYVNDGTTRQAGQHFVEAALQGLAG